jgi:hypothetical protein
MWAYIYDIDYSDDDWYYDDKYVNETAGMESRKVEQDTDALWVRAPGLCALEWTGKLTLFSASGEVCRVERS